MEITQEITVEELMRQYPRTIKVLMNYGIRALVCGEPAWGTLREVAEKNGVENLDKLLNDLNREIESEPVDNM